MIHAIERKCWDLSSRIVKKMFEFWEREPTEDETEAVIEKVATIIRKRRLETPAILAIEMHKPLANVGANAALAFSPFLAPFIGAERLGNYTAIFRSRENLERLVAKLASPRDDDSSPPSAGSGFGSESGAQ